MFAEPLEFQSKVFGTLMDIGIIPKSDSVYLAVKYYEPIYFFDQRWLFSGELSEEQTNSFRNAAYQHIKKFFAEMEVE